jgi:hypothetical protein
MPHLYKKNLLASPLDTPELPEGDEMEEDDDPVKTFLEWDAPARPYIKRGRSYYTYSAVIAILVILISLLAGWFLLIGAILALLFLVYVINFVPPEDVHYKISTQGITINEHFYHWQELNSFWVMKKDGSRLLFVSTQRRFPAVLILVLREDISDEKVQKVVAKFLPFHEIPPRSLMDKWSEGLQRHFPLENPQH